MVERRRGVLWGALDRKDGDQTRDTSPVRMMSRAMATNIRKTRHSASCCCSFAALNSICLSFVQKHSRRHCRAGQKGVDENREKIVRLMSIPILHRL
jgi:predicted secreted Zn-dependent protease